MTEPTHTPKAIAHAAEVALALFYGAFGGFIAARFFHAYWG